MSAYDPKQMLLAHTYCRELVARSEDNDLILSSALHHFLSYSSVATEVVAAKGRQIE